MKKYIIIIAMTLIIFSSCSNNQNSEKQKEKQIEENLNKNIISINDINEELATLDKLIQGNKLSDEELVNRGSKLQIFAGENPISSKDTLILENALICFKKALEINNKNETAYTNLVTVLCSLKRYREALNIIKKNIDMKEDFAEGYSYQGFIYEKLNILDTAQIMYRKAIQSYNDRLKKRININDEINRAFLLFFTKGKIEALKEYNRIVNKNPNDHYVRNMKYAFEYFDRKEFIDENLK